MAYNTSKGKRDLGDLINEDDTDTKIDFGSDSITLVTNNVNRVVVNNSALSASGQLTVEGAVVLGGTFQPLASNSADLGASGKKWKDIYVDGIGYIDQIGTDGTPSTAYINAGELDGVSIGSESPSTAIFTTVSGTTGGFTAVTATSLNLQGGGISNGGAFGGTTLSASSTLSVEGAAYLASTLGVTGALSCTNTISGSGNLTIQGNTVLGGTFRPLSTNTNDLGSSGLKWKDVYVDGIGYIDQIGTDAAPSTAYINAGEIDGTAIGSESPSTAIFTTVSGTTGGFTGITATSLNLQNGGATNVGNLGGVTGLATTYLSASSTLSVVGNAWLGAALGVTGALSCTNTISGSGNLTIQGNTVLGGTFQPLITNHADLGASGKKWKDAYVDGIGYIDQIGTDGTPSTVYMNAGEIDGTVIGGESPAAGAFTSLSASQTLSVEGNVYAASGVRVTGSVTAAQVTASQGVAVAADDFTVSVGASADLRMYHASNDSYIQNATGHLTIDNNATDKHIRLKLGEDNSDTAVQIRNNSNDTVWRCGANGSVSGSGNLTTQGITNCNAGLTVTGSAIVAGNLSASLNISGSSFYVENRIVHTGDPDTYISLTTDDINFQAGGVNFLDLTEDTQNEVTFNEAGVDIDFRVETADESHMLFIEGSSNRMSIGDNTGSPGATLEIKNHASAGATGVPLLQLNNNDTDQQCVDINAGNIDANVVNITANDVTTARVLAIGADGLTTGNALYVDDNSSNTGTRNTALIIQNNAAAINAQALAVQSDGGKTGIKLDKNYSDTTEASIVGLDIDWDKTGASTSDNTMYGIQLDMDNTTATNGNNYTYGLHVTPTLTHAANAGASFVYGALINARGGTNGSSLVQGARIEAGGGDINYGIQLDVEDGGVDLRIESSADNGDYFQIQTTTNGATTLTTNDDDGTAAHLTCSVDGDLLLNPVGTLYVNGDSYLSGSRRVNYKYMVVDYTLTSDDYILIFNGANKTATLPALSATNNGVTYIIKNTHATSLTVTGAAGGAGKIDGQQTKTLAQGSSCWVLGFNNGSSYGWALLPEK